MVVVRRGRHCIRIPGVRYLLPTPMPNRFSIENGILHYVPQEGDAAFDQEAPEPEQVDEEDLATDEEEEQPQEEAHKKKPTPPTRTSTVFRAPSMIWATSPSPFETRPCTWTPASPTGAKDGLLISRRHNDLTGLGLQKLKLGGGHYHVSIKMWRCYFNKL